VDCKGGEARRRRRERNAIREERDEERKARAGKEAAGDKTFFRFGGIIPQLSIFSVCPRVLSNKCPYLWATRSIL